jgi:hypothetical protein
MKERTIRVLERLKELVPRKDNKKVKRENILDISKEIWKKGGVAR